LLDVIAKIKSFRRDPIKFAMPRFVSYKKKISFSLKNNIKYLPEKELVGIFGVGIFSLPFNNKPLKIVKATIGVIGNRIRIVYMFIKRKPVPEEFPVKKLKCVGIDIGVKKIAVLSTGRFYSYSTIERKLIKKRDDYIEGLRNLTKKGKHYCRRYKQLKVRIEEMTGRIKEIKEATIKHIMNYIRTKFNVIFIEKNLIAIHRLSKIRNINENVCKSNMFKLYTKIIEINKIYKNIKVIEVPNAFTSKRCNECGKQSAESRKGDRFKCIFCGHKANADLNASLNILQRGLEIIKGKSLFGLCPISNIA
jgi:transposase